MNETAQTLIQAQNNTADLLSLAGKTFTFIMTELEQDRSTLTGVRIQSLLESVGAWDPAVIQAFEQVLKSGEAALRVTLYDLLAILELSEESGVQLYQTTADADARWMALILVAHAYKSGYPVNNLDPASPPAIHTPAGIILQQTGQFVRQQTLRSPTERDRLAHKLLYNNLANTAVASAPDLETMPPAEHSETANPPHYRTPVPVNYSEYSAEVKITLEDIDSPAPASGGSAALTITEADLIPDTNLPTRAPAMRVTYDQIEQANYQHIRRPQQQRRRRPTPPPQGSNFSDSLRGFFASEEMKSTRLRITVLVHPEGPGIRGLQVKVTCKGIRSYVAGITDQAGRFVCQLPVRANGGLTYDVEVTWPRDDGGEVETKSITLSADRTEFSLPFYQRMRA